MFSIHFLLYFFFSTYFSAEWPVLLRQHILEWIITLRQMDCFGREWLWLLLDLVVSNQYYREDQNKWVAIIRNSSEFDWRFKSIIQPIMGTDALILTVSPLGADQFDAKHKTDEQKKIAKEKRSSFFSLSSPFVSQLYQ